MGFYQMYGETKLATNCTKIKKRYVEYESLTNYFAKSMTKFFRFFADTFFAKRYGHRAVVLETVAGVPGMVAGMLVHLKSLRTHKRGYGPIIRKLLAEAENERMHLMFFIEIAQPNKLERGLIITAQFIFWHFYLVLYLISPRTAHMMTHYFEEEAVKSYTEYLDLIYREEIEDVPAPQLAIEYYGMDADARLSTMVKHIRADEQNHSKVNLEYANVLR
jgi:ubiquinol oxidase